MPRVSIIVPVCITEAGFGDTLRSLLAQSYSDFEIIIVNDGEGDQVDAVAEVFLDPRLRILRQEKRGMAGARNTGISRARGRYIGFCEPGDLWQPWKLADHVVHLDATPDLGVSFSASAPLRGCDALCDPLRECGAQVARPLPSGPIGAADVMQHDFIGRSTPVLRREVLRDMAFRPAQEDARDWYFDERLRHAEDTEFWLRLLLETRWQIAAVQGVPARHRVKSPRQAAGIDVQYAYWMRVMRRLTPQAPEFFHENLPAAHAYKLRRLARQAVRCGIAEDALPLAVESVKTSRRPLLEDPLGTLGTLAAAWVLRAGGGEVLMRLFARRHGVSRS